jgi:murein peptide amidase A
VATTGISDQLVLDPSTFLSRVEAAAAKARFRIERFEELAGHALLALTKRTAGPRPRIYISAGIHGDEPAGPLTILSLLNRGVFDDRAIWFLCPMLNPVGFARRTRENAEGLDLNRDYKSLKSAEIQAHARWLKRQPNFDLVLCVHEDWESRGYYLYELNPAGRATLANPIIEAVRTVCPIEQATVIDGREISEPGIIRPISDPLLRELWPESIYLRAHHTHLSYTLESPSALPLEQRIAAHSAAIETAIAKL